MLSSIRTEGHSRRRASGLAPGLAVLCALAAGCSPAGQANSRSSERAAPEAIPSSQPAIAAVPKVSVGEPEAKSKVIGKRDFMLRGNPACEISFVYAGWDAETLFWEEPCNAVSAWMLTPGDLQRVDKWRRLDRFAQEFVRALPQQRVLYVEGSFSASVFPVGTTGSTYEVAVAD